MSRRRPRHPHPNLAAGGPDKLAVELPEQRALLGNARHMRMQGTVVPRNRVQAHRKVNLRPLLCT